MRPGLGGKVGDGLCGNSPHTFLHSRVCAILARPCTIVNHFREESRALRKALAAAQRHVSIDFDAFRSLDRQRREIITAGERLKADRNKAGEEIARRKRAGQDAGDLLARMKSVSNEIKRADEQIAAFDVRLLDFMLSVPNLPHSSVRG